MGIKRDNKLFEAYAEIRVYCTNCGHTLYIPNPMKFKICDWCGNKTYRNRQEEFLDKLKKAQIKEKKNER